MVNVKPTELILIRINDIIYICIWYHKFLLEFTIILTQMKPKAAIVMTRVIQLFQNKIGYWYNTVT